MLGILNLGSITGGSKVGLQGSVKLYVAKSSLWFSLSPSPYWYHPQLLYSQNSLHSKNVKQTMIHIFQPLRIKFNPTFLVIKQKSGSAVSGMIFSLQRLKEIGNSEWCSIKQKINWNTPRNWGFVIYLR